MPVHWFNSLKSCEIEYCIGAEYDWQTADSRKQGAAGGRRNPRAAGQVLQVKGKPKGSPAKLLPPPDTPALLQLYHPQQGVH